MADDTIRCLCAKCAAFTEHTIPGGKCTVCAASLPTGEDIAEMGDQIPVSLGWRDLLHIVQMMHSQAGSRKLTVKDRREKPQFCDEHWCGLQLKMAKQEEEIVRQLIAAHVANGGDHEDFARL